MGGILAKSPEPAQKFDFALPEPEKQVQPATPAETSDLFKNNPGTVDELHKKCKDVQPLGFDGGRFTLQKGLSNHFQISHSINLPLAEPGNYRYGSTYVGTKQFSPTEVFPVLLGDIDSSGNLNANIIHQFMPRLRCRLATQIQDSKVAALQLTNEYRGTNYSFTLTAANPNVLNNSGVLVAQYLQTVTPNLALGTELAYNSHPNMPGGHMAVASLLGRYNTSESTWSGTLGLTDVHLCYYRKASEQLQIGIEVETSLRSKESTALVGFQIDLPKADLQYRGAITSNGTVSGVLEKRLSPLPMTLMLSGRLHHSKGLFRPGIGLTIG